MADLSLVPVGELMEELKNRYTHLIFSGIKVTGHDRDEQYTMWDGHAVFCQGLIASLMRDIQDWERDTSEEGEAGG